MKAHYCWIAVGDIHDDVTRLEQIPELADASGVIVTGDITFAGGIGKAERVMQVIAQKTPMIMAQIGNMDKPEVTGWLEEKGWNIHAGAKELVPDVVVMGLGCSPATPFKTPSEYPEHCLQAWLDEACAKAEQLRQQSTHRVSEGAVQSILVSHTPPHNTRCDKLSDGTPVGSTAVRAFVEKYQPALCLCGHIHEARGEDHIGNTRIINPGTLADGGYILLTFDVAAGRLDAELKVL